MLLLRLQDSSRLDRGSECSCRVHHLVMRSHKPKLEVFEARLHQPVIFVILL